MPSVPPFQFISLATRSFSNKLRMLHDFTSNKNRGHSSCLIFFILIYLLISNLCIFFFVSFNLRELKMHYIVSFSFLTTIERLWYRRWELLSADWLSIAHEDQAWAEVRGWACSVFKDMHSSELARIWTEGLMLMMPRLALLFCSTCLSVPNVYTTVGKKISSLTSLYLSYVCERQGDR